MPTRRLVSAIALAAVALTAFDADAARRRTPRTTFEFRVPTGSPSPLYESTTVTVPNVDVFEAFDEFETEFVVLIEGSIASAPGVRRLNSFTYEFPVPVVTLSGEQTTIVAALSGVTEAHLDVDYRPDDSLVRLLCGSSVDASAHVTDLSLELSYDFYTGDPLDVEVGYSSIDVDYDCSVPIIGDLVQFLNDTFGFFDVVEAVIEAIDSGESAAEEALNARFTNLFSLRDALADVTEDGPLEIRDAAEDVLGVLGGASTAAATFIARHITDELVVRLDLQTQAEIDELRELLRGLEDTIAAGIPGLSDLSFGQLTSPSFDLSDYLDANLPDLEATLLDRLDAVYADAVSAVQDLESRAVDALEEFLGSDWSRLFGGVNVRLSLVRDLKLVILDAYHDAPASFVGRSEAVAPCLPDYTIAETENVRRYSIYNGPGDRIYRGPDRFHLVAGLLRSVSAENHFGLHSYPTYGEVVLYGWADYGGNPDDFRWPQCPVPTSTSPSSGGSGSGGSGSGGSGSGGSGSGGSGGPPDEPPCGGNTGVICP